SKGAAWTGERLSALGFDPVTIEFVTTAYRARSRMDLELDLTASRLEFDPSTGRVTGGARPACSRFLGAWVGDRLIALGEVPAGAATVTLTPAPPGSVRTFTVVVGRDPTLAAGPCRGELFTCTSPLG